MVITIEVCADGNWLIQVSAYFYPSLSKKVYYIKCKRSRRDAMESLCLPKINTKIPTRTKTVEMNKIVTNLEIQLHHFLRESNWKKQPREMFNKEGFLENFEKLTGKHLCPSPTQVFSCQFYKIFENTFFTEHFRVNTFDE